MLHVQRNICKPSVGGAFKNKRTFFGPHCEVHTIFDMVSCMRERGIAVMPVFAGDKNRISIKTPTGHDHSEKNHQTVAIDRFRKCRLSSGLATGDQGFAILHLRS